MTGTRTASTTSSTSSTDPTGAGSRAAALAARLRHPDPSARLRAALAAGAAPDGAQVEALVARCALEPVFEVRDMLTWALTRHDRAATVDRLVTETRSPVPQARSQALHTLSKVGDRRAWPAVTPALLHDPDDEVARAAWRAAVALVPEADAAGLAGRLLRELGRGPRPVRASLSRALVALGAAAGPGLEAASRHPDEQVRAHALATRRLAEDPGRGDDDAVAEAARTVALLGAPLVEG